MLQWRIISTRNPELSLWWLNEIIHCICSNWPQRSRPRRQDLSYAAPASSERADPRRARIPGIYLGTRWTQTCTFHPRVSSGRTGPCVPPPQFPVEGPWPQGRSHCDPCSMPLSSCHFCWYTAWLKSPAFALGKSHCRCGCWTCSQADIAPAQTGLAVGIVRHCWAAGICCPCIGDYTWGCERNLCKSQPPLHSLIRRRSRRRSSLSPKIGQVSSYWSPSGRLGESIRSVLLSRRGACFVLLPEQVCPVQIQSFTYCFSINAADPSNGCGDNPSGWSLSLSRHGLLYTKES